MADTKPEAEFHAATLREIATWNISHELDIVDDLRDAADFIERQQQDIDYLRRRRTQP